MEGSLAEASGGEDTLPDKEPDAVTRIERLEVRGFRNVQAVTLDPGRQFNVIYGDNGAGKSSLIEALYYVGALRSFRGGKTDDLVGRDAPAAGIRVRVSDSAAARVYRVELSPGKARRLAVDGKRPRSIARWHLSFHMVLFHPGDLTLAAGSPEGRRAFVDRILEQLDPTYASALASYTKALKSRNRLLKTEGVDRRSIVAYNDLLASAGAVVGSSRARLIQEIAVASERAFARVTDEALPLSVRYRPRVPPTMESLREALERSISKDLARGFTAEGPHADDVDFVVDSSDESSRTAKQFASQGQQRALVLALKIAELEVLTRRSGRVPVLLLDDLSSELDRTRNRRFFEELRGLGGQVFLTTTHPEFILLERDRSDFEIRDGALVMGG